MNDFLKNFKEYGKLPEMRVLWIFLFLTALILAIDAIYLSLLWTLVSAAILVSIGAVMAVINIRASRSNVQLRAEKQRVDNIITSMNDGALVYDQDFIVTLFNRAAGEIFSLSAQEIIGRKLTPESVRDPKLSVLAKVIFQSLAPRIIRRSAEGEYPQVVDISFDEPQLELRVSTDRLLDENGNVAGFLKIIRDRTREVELVRAKSDFITVAAHQLRTPLSAVSWALQSLVSEKLEDGQKEIVNTGLAAANNLLKIVEDLLNVAKIEEGKFGYNFQKTDLVLFLRSIINQAMPVAKEYQVKLFMEPAEQQITADIDPERLALVVINLLENGIKYNIPSGQVVVSAFLRPDEPFVQVDVRDTGIGMSQETLNKLFTKFFRGENVAVKETEGSGLGLFMAKNIVRRHGGQIWAESEINRGTTFHFTLPLDSRLIPTKEFSVSE